MLAKSVVSLLLLLFFSGCSNYSEQDLQKKGEKLVQAIAKDLQKIRSKEDLQVALNPLKKKMKKLCTLMIQSEQSQARQKGFTGTLKEKTLYSDQLQYEMMRVCEIEGGQQALEKIQADMLDRLDACQRREKRKKLSQSKYFQAK